MAPSPPPRRCWNDAAPRASPAAATATCTWATSCWSTASRSCFDCIEFNDHLSQIDVLYDVAFLMMDLDFRGRTEAANRVLNAYLDEAARTFPVELWDGLAAVPVMLSARASVRTHVTAFQDDLETARRYL